ncbi:zinc metallochaperone AztD [Georgenia wangjunii]|uniref:zinc metallochaperone AztD n=1 Tax=Georgenia wangjunii TaxID=3117730 RepID=UPI002F269D5E
MRRPTPLPALAAVTLAATLAGCSGAGTTPAASTATPTAEATTATGDDDGAALVEVATLDPRIVMTYDGGIMTLDTGSGEILDDVELPGYLRVNAAGDGRHVLITTAEGFHAYDGALLAEAHGDHAHYRAGDPRLTDLVLPAEEAGHVVVHAGRTALFADGTGEVQVLDPTELADGEPHVDTWTAPDAAHHGVAVALSDGTLFSSAGDDDGRYGAVVLDADGNEITGSDDCPGLHGEAVAAGEAVVVGCENGPLLLSGGAFSKVPVEDAYARSGNLVGHETSAVVLGDYKTDPEADLERPERIALIDTATGTLRLVDLGASYSFRSLARGPQGEAFVLATDGTLRVINPDTGEELARALIVAPWEEPLEWQQPRPALHVADSIAYVTEPATNQLHAVSLSTGEVMRSYDLPHTPDEITSVTGSPPPAIEAGAPGTEDAHEEEGEDHDHEGEDQGHDHEGETHDH